MTIKIIWLFLVLYSATRLKGQGSVSKRCFSPVYCSTQESSHPDWIQVYPPPSCHRLLESEWSQEIAIRLNASESTIAKRLNEDLQELEVKLFNSSCCNKNASFEDAVETLERDLQEVQEGVNNTLKDINQLNDDYARLNVVVVSLQQVANSTSELHQEDVNEIQQSIAGQMDQITAIQNLTAKLLTLFDYANSSLVNNERDIRRNEETLAMMINTTGIIQQRVAEHEKNFTQRFDVIEQTFNLLYNLANMSLVNTTEILMSVSIFRTVSDITDMFANEDKKIMDSITALNTSVNVTLLQIFSDLAVVEKSLQDLNSNITRDLVNWTAIIMLRLGELEERTNDSDVAELWLGLHELRTNISNSVASELQKNEIFLSNLHEKVNSTIDFHQRDIEELNGTLIKYSQNISEIEEDLALLGGKINNDSLDCNVKIEEIKNRTEDLEQVVSQLSTITNLTNLTILQLNQTLEDYRTDFGELSLKQSTDFEMISIKLDENQENITNLSRKYEELDTKYDLLEEEINTTKYKHENDFTQISEQLSELKGNVSEYQNETNSSIQVINSKIGSLEQTVEELSNNQTIGFAKLASNLMQFYRNLTIQLKEQANLTGDQLEAFENTLNQTYEDLLANRNCPDVLYNKKCYVPVILSGTLEELRGRCTQRGGQPANVYNEEHLNLIAEKVRRVYLGNTIYIDFNLGMTFNSTSGNITSTDGQSVQSFKWKLNYPLQIPSFTGILLRVNREMNSTNQNYLNIDSSTRSDGILCEIDT